MDNNEIDMDTPHVMSLQKVLAGNYSYAVNHVANELLEHDYIAFGKWLKSLSKIDHAHLFYTCREAMLATFDNPNMFYNELIVLGFLLAHGEGNPAPLKEANDVVKKLMLFITAEQMVREGFITIDYSHLSITDTLDNVFDWYDTLITDALKDE